MWRVCALRDNQSVVRERFKQLAQRLHVYRFLKECLPQGSSIAKTRIPPRGYRTSGGMTGSQQPLGETLILRTAPARPAQCFLPKPILPDDLVCFREILAGKVSIERCRWEIVWVSNSIDLRNTAFRLCGSSQSRRPARFWASRSGIPTLNTKQVCISIRA